MTNRAVMWRAVAVVSVCAAALGASGTSAVSAAPVAEPCARDYCVSDEIELPGAPGEPATPAPGAPGGGVGGGVRGGATPVGNGGSTATEVCTWLRDPGPIGRSGNRGEPGPFPDVGPRISPDAYLVFEVCDGEITARVRWATPATPAAATPGAQPATPAPAPPTPEELAGRVRVRLVGDLPQPSATTSPAAGEPAVVNHPTFLALDDWTETVTDEECAFLLCVTVTATAQLTWNPGEPGAAPVVCDAGGTTYDPTGPPVADQAAAPGACTHAYTQRTGAAGRPATWPGTATVTWNLTWTSTAGPGGTLTPVTRTVDLPRAVDEVQAIVVR